MRVREVIALLSKIDPEVVICVGHDVGVDELTPSDFVVRESVTTGYPHHPILTNVIVIEG